MPGRSEKNDRPSTFRERRAAEKKKKYKNLHRDTNDLPPYRVIRSSRRTLAVEITASGEVLLRVPRGVSDREVRAFAADQAGWIRTHYAQMQRRLEEAAAHPVEPLSERERAELVQSMQSRLPERVAYWAQRVGVHCGRVTLRRQKTRWGSCSARGNLNFNVLLGLAPPKVLDYVIVHELCHLLQMNHSAEFWRQVERVMPDYRQPRQWLKEHGPQMQEKWPVA
ncbi:MAG: M48 family metallopeptidase [Anaerovoracaceae bacterium]|jgi:predicted metal-dependent hydrolase